MSDREHDIEQGAGDIPDEDLGATDVPDETDGDVTDPVEERPESSSVPEGSPVGAVFHSGS